MFKDKIVEFLHNFRNPRYLLRLFLIAVAYYIFAKLGLSFAFGVKQVTLVWPPTGIAIASLLLLGGKHWPAVLIGAFAANITTNETFPIAAAIAVGNTLEALLALYLLSMVKFDKDFHHVGDILKFIFWASLVSTLVSATIGTTTLGYGGTIGWNNYWPTWLTWWLGDATGAVIFGPLILAYSNYKYLKFGVVRILRAIFLVLSTTLVSIFAFTGFISPLLANYPVRYVIFPFIIWAAFDFGVPGATWVTAIIAITSIWGFASPDSPFLQGKPEEFGLTILQLSTAVYGITSLVLAAMTEGAKKFTEDLELINSDLEKYRLAVENASDHIIITDSKGHILYANDAAEKITGYSKAEMMGRTPALWGGQMPDGFYKKLWHTISVDKNTFATQITNKRKNGESYTAEIALTPILNKRGEPQFFVGIERDVTEHLKLDSIRMDFVSMAAHELRSPLGSIRWYTESLESTPFPRGSKAKEYVGAIYSSVLKMTSLVNLLLNVSKVELGTIAEKRESVNVVALADDVISSFPDIQVRGIKITKKYHPQNITALIDPNLLRIILENLVGNSIKYTADLGRLSLIVVKTNDSLDIELKDTGIGIPESQKKLVFTKLFRADNVKRTYPEGTGLGLYLVKAVVDKLKGKISFESEEGKGTTFWVSLPLGN
ncbi:MAG TPA: MASE1 domain-containing protein [Patescibacteria group bacterium]|nr:MASE1 domain-containing protein [Patescibacteria group bacterium]